MKYSKTLSLSGLIFGILLLISASAFSQEKLEITHGPYLVDPTEDAITVVWFTNLPCVSWVEYSGDQSFGTFPTWGGYPDTARSSRQGLIDANTTRHIIRIKNLEPGKNYKYRVNSKEIIQFNPYEVLFGETIVGEVHQFTTLNADPVEFTFGVVSDIHETDRILYDLDKVSPLNKLDMVFLNGDILNWIGSEERIFRGFLDASVELYAKETPFVYIRGNHETRGPNARGVMDYFPHHSGEIYYSMYHGGVHFTILDCGEDKPDSHPVYAGLVDFDAYRTEQAEWLKKEVQTEQFKNADYRIVVVHIPISTESRGHGSQDLARKVAPILNEANIDLVISGHTHRFDRIEAGESTNNFPTLITGKEMILEGKVTGKQINFTVKNTANEVVDSFKIQKK